MKVVKKINHNVILVEENGIEKMAMGKGIGFFATVGNPFKASEAEKFFVLDTKQKMKRFSEVIAQIPIEYIDFAEEVINYIISEVETPLDSNIYITLTDHIYFTIQRARIKMNPTSIMVPEMKLFYPKEYKIAQNVVLMINEKYETKLEDNEVGFITMHILNAQLGEINSLNSLKILEITTKILQLISQELKLKMDEDSLAYSRLLVHLKFLAKRLIYQEISKVRDVNFFTKEYKNSIYYKTSLSISQQISAEFNVDIGENEILYLTLHISRI
ncbi:MAG: PRD domain-containing protein [Culicoidibacterales bacterium]